VAVMCGCVALVMVGYALGSRRSTLIRNGGMVSEVGAILTEADFKSLYAEVTKGLTDTQLTATNAQITGTGTVTNANVNLLKAWYAAGTATNKVFANNLIIASVTAAKTSTASTSTDTATIKCPATVTTYAAFGHFYSQETAGKTWPAINKIDSWVRGALPAVGAPLSVRKLRDCYKNTLTTANRKDFDENAVVHMKAGASR